MKQSLFLVYIFSVVVLSSCGSQKNISYFQDLNKDVEKKLASSDSLVLHQTTLKPNDELLITVSSINPQVVAPFNTAPSDGKASNYLVDNNGEINFPVLGKLKIAGMTTAQVAAMIERKLLNEYVNDAIVNVRLSNFKVSILGAVNAPGSYYYTSQRVSVLDAIASARDLTLYADRKNVLLIRDNNGQAQHLWFDLTNSQSVFDSPNYYLQQNDILVVDLNNQKQKDAGMTQQKQFNLTLITTAITSVISTISLIIAVSKN